MDTREIDHIGMCFADCQISMSDKNKDEYSRVFGYAKEWYSELSEFDARCVSMSLLEKRCRAYMIPKAKPAGLIPGVVWFFIGKMILNYIIARIMEHLKNRRA